MSEQRFVKFGRVTAKRLTEPLDWQSARGDEMHGEPGDWVVTGEDGEPRTVKDPQFRASHRHVEGDVWERTGEVTAWRTHRAMVVQTLEGEATAEPGDWILTSGQGESWPVPDEQFRASYRPA